MKGIELLKLLGNVDDKFYKEAMGDEPLEPIPVTVSKKRGSLIPAAAAFAVAAGITVTVGLLIYRGGLMEGHVRDTPLIVTETTDFEETSDISDSSKITQDDIDYCLTYTMETQNMLNGTRKDFTEITRDTLSYYLADLNFDGNEEILVADFNNCCPVYIFEKIDGKPFFNASIAQDIRFDIDEREFSKLAIYETDTEKYHYFYLTFEDNTIDMSAKIAAAIKYDGERYYIDYLLSYGAMGVYPPPSYGENGYESDYIERFFFRRGWKNPGDNFSWADYIETEYAEFKKLWGQYYALPAVTLQDISKRAEEQSGFDDCGYRILDLTQVPDIKGSHLYARSDGYNVSAVEEENYSVMYNSYAKVLLCSKQTGNYSFDLVAENLSTDKSENPDMLYCSDTYTVVKRLDTGKTMAVIYSGYREIPINNEDFSDYAVQAFEMKDGIVIYTPSRDIYGGYSPFFTFDEDTGAMHLLYGDYSSLLENHGEFSQIQKLGVHFVSDPEANSLYYDGNCYVFDFTKIGAGFDENGLIIPCFTVKSALDVREDDFFF